MEVPPRGPPDGRGGRRPKILLVDDEPEVLWSLAAVLAAGMPEAELLPASSAEGALRLAASGTVEVVIADFFLRGTDGVVFLSQVRERWPDVGRILLTGRADLDVAMRAINEAHVDRFLLKPARSERLVGAVREVVAERRAYRDLRAAFDREEEPERRAKEWPQT